MLTSLFLLAKYRDMNEEELEEALTEKNVNTRESLAPIYIREYLMNHKDKRFQAADLLNVLKDSPYRLEMTLNAVRRVLNTIALYDEECFRIRDGHKFYYFAADEIPKGYVADDEIG